MPKAFITGLAGPDLSAQEAAFLASAAPCGIILFARNCKTAPQIRKLVADARAAVGRDRIVVLIDQEGGRVQRLRPPLGRALPPAAAYAGRGQDAEAVARDIAHVLAADLRDLGIDTDCAPVLDVPVPGAHDIIDDRAFATAPGQVAALGRAFGEGLMRGGVLPVIKHIPGHGRARADSHLELPLVATPHDTLSVTDFAPFRALNDFPCAMTAHVVFTAIDERMPASVSARVHERVIRGEIGFDGLLMSDDLSMRALSGSLGERTAAVIAAGSDIALHCNGDLAEMREVAAACPALTGHALRRFEAALAVTEAGAVPSPETTARAEAALDELLAARNRGAESV